MLEEKEMKCLQIETMWDCVEDIDADDDDDDGAGVATSNKRGR